MCSAKQNEGSLHKYAHSDKGKSMDVGCWMPAPMDIVYDRDASPPHLCRVEQSILVYTCCGGAPSPAIPHGRLHKYVPAGVGGFQCIYRVPLFADLRCLYDTQAEAEAAAKELGCSGAHKMGTKWMPGSDHMACHQHTSGAMCYSAFFDPMILVLCMVLGLVLAV